MRPSRRSRFRRSIWPAARRLQVVVDREAGQYLGHPTTVLLEDGKTMIIVYPKGHGRGGDRHEAQHRRRAHLERPAADAGELGHERWKCRRSTARSTRPARSGSIMFSGLYPIRRAVSEDDGATWSELEPIGDYGGIVACASCDRLEERRLHGPVPRRRPVPHEREPAKGSAAKFIVYKILSSDGGLTWSKPTAIATHDGAHLCEPGMVRSPDGKQIAVLLRENARKLHSFVIFSDDEGETWTEPTRAAGRA